MELNSCLYECTVMHHRLAPKVHRFQYRIFMFYFDLDEIDEISRRIPLFSRNRFNLYSFFDRDYLPLSASDARGNLISYLMENGVVFPASGRIMLLTLPRVLGYIFNPVSFYFCFDCEGRAICSVVQVGNTFREIKPFLIREPAADGNFRLTAPKHFYVSPFSSLDLQFEFNLRIPGEKLVIQIDDRDGEKKTLLSALQGQRVSLETSSVVLFTVKYPLITLKVILLIHWHALLLWSKGISFYRKADRADLQRGVLRPHPSIAGKVK